MNNLFHFSIYHNGGKPKQLILNNFLLRFLSFSKWVLHFQLFSDIHTRYKNSTYQHPKKKEKSPKNAILINLKNTLGGEKFTVEDVKQELAPSVFKK